MHTYYAINLMLNIWHDATRDTNCQFRLTLGTVYMYWCFEGGFWCSDVNSTIFCDKWPMHFDWVIIVRSVRLSSLQCSHAKHLIGHYYLAGNWAADEWATDGHLWMETAEASTFPLLNKANVPLGALNYCDNSFDINENHFVFSNLYTRYYKHICRRQKRYVYVAVMVTRMNVWKWRRLDHGL